MKLYITLFFTIALSVFDVNSQNLLNNGNLEVGGSGVGFFVDGAGYNLITAPFSGTTSPGNYAFTNNPQPMNTANFIAGGDHTTGTGNMMVIDGNSTGGSQRFWKAGNNGGGVCGLTVGATYTFRYWIKSVSTTVTSNATRANIGIQFNNATNVTLVSGAALAPLPASGWQEVVYTVRPTNACVNIELWNNNTNLVGNDFAVDDFSFTPPPAALSLSYSLNGQTCGGINNGAIVGYANGGGTSYTYALTATSGASVTNTNGLFFGLAPGTYSLSVNDGTTTVTQNSIIVTPAPDLTVSSNTSVCAGNAIPLSVSGGTPPYNWTASPADASLITPSANPSVSPTVTTTYTVTSNTSTLTNLIYNGNFSAGNAGFTTDHTYHNPTNVGLVQRAYGIVTNSNTWEGGFSPCTDHTTGTGNMMVVDGSITNGGNDRLWCQTVPVTAGQTYTFSYWIQTVAVPNPGSIEVLINGVSIGAPTLAPATTCNWVQRTLTWNSGANTVAQICMYNRTTSLTGNDFALDDISFTTNVACTLQKTVTITVLSNVNLVVTNPPTVCSPATVNITLPAVTNGSTTGTTLTYWIDLGATIPLAVPTAIAVSGTYFIKSTLGTCSVIRPVVVTINAAGTIAAPVVQTPLYYCQNMVASQLTATALPGATLNWYGTNATGGVPSLIAPTPQTATLGSTTYYVSQSTGACESPRVGIVVHVFDSTGLSYNLVCAPASVPTSVGFDWNNINGLPIGDLPHNYTITYSINGGPLVTVTNVGPSSYEVPGVQPGQSVTLNIIANGGLKCLLPVSNTCERACLVRTTPDFPATYGPICFGTTAPVLPTVSPNGISGSWSPSVVSNTVTTTYTFTPNNALFPCANSVTRTITVTPVTNAGLLNGTQNVCVGLTTQFSSTTAGGSWSSLNAAIATVNPTSGLVTGVGAGTTTITYLVTGINGCSNDSVTRTVTVTAAPTMPTLGGTQTVCVGNTSTYNVASGPTGGTWSSVNTAIATVTPSGSSATINAIAVGTTTINYTITGTGGCANVIATRTVTVTAVPTAAAINGSQNVCVGNSPQYTSSPAGGVWASSNTAVATISAAGLINTLAAGTATISYTITPPGNCNPVVSTRVITVTAAPVVASLSGNQNICAGQNVNYVATITGGTWSSTNTAVATVNAAGQVRGIIAGTATINYTITGTGGCANAVASRIVTVTATPNPGTISGTQAICAGTTTQFATNGSGGTWSSSNAGIASVSSTGLVSGLLQGTVTISYTVLGTGGCTTASATRTVTVSLPANAGSLSGNQNICEGSTALFGSTSAGGSWSSSNTAVATVNPTTGLVTALIPGTTTITYLVTGIGGCLNASATRPVTVIQKVTPTFVQVSPVCSGSVMAPLPTTSTNGIPGTWSPALNNTANTTYTFTPATGQCANTAQMTIVITPRLTPTFDPISVQCENDPNVPVLPTTSQNGIVGTWSPAVVNLATLGVSNYVFTPNPGQCVTPGSITLSITVIAITITNFPPIAPFCYGKTSVPTLQTTSPNGVEGTWSPPVISNTQSGTYVFTPNSVTVNQCATVQTLNVTVIPKTIPNFAFLPFCVNTTAPVLGLTSPNGVNGTWSPATVDNTMVGVQQYTFTPDPGECAESQIVDVMVTPGTDPAFADIALCKDTAPPTLAVVSPSGVNGTWAPAVIDNTLVGTNPYLFTPLTGECGVPQTINVTVNEYRLSNVQGIVSNYFEEEQIITVIASGPGEYWFQLDNGPLQESNVFTDVPAGLHTITVVDKNGCGPAISNPNIMVINYPKFFTPNDDGFNDTWNISGLKDQWNSHIFIFDRYGKLLKEISPKGLGWDGTYNGAEMPSTDYWFTVDYEENGVPKQFKAHFTLKR